MRLCLTTFHIIEAERQSLVSPLTVARLHVALHARSHRFPIFDPLVVYLVHPRVVVLDIFHPNHALQQVRLIRPGER